MSDLNKKFPFDVRIIDSKYGEELRKVFNGMMSISDTRYGPNGCLLPQKFQRMGKDIYNMEIRADDIFVLTFPRSGTTWTQDMVWLIANNFDFQKAVEIPLSERYPFIDMAMFLDLEAMTMLPDAKRQQVSQALSVLTIEKLTAMDSPRFIKSHLPFTLLPPNLLDTCKVVYVARDPRDVAVSLYHYTKLMKMASDLDFKVYWNFFIRDLLPLTPYFAHVKEAWNARHHPNLLFLFYEELSMNLPTCARRVAKFLGKPITDEQVVQLSDHLNIDNFRKNESVNRVDMQTLGLLDKNESFIRNGKVGGWREYFNEEMTEQAENWIQENLKDTDLRFP